MKFKPKNFKTIIIIHCSFWAQLKNAIKFPCILEKQRKRLLKIGQNSFGGAKKILKTPQQGCDAS